MPRIPKAKPGVRLTMDIPVQTREVIVALRDKLHADSMTEVVRRAILFYDHVVQAKTITSTKKGAELLIRSRKGETVVEFF
jgi:hypothetical protein